MSDEIKKDRSPNYPRAPLKDAVEWAARLYQKAGKAPIRPEVAASALGYKGLNGASLGTLGTLNQYGLIDKERGGNVAISSLALKILHPVSKAQELEAKVLAATQPRIFAELIESGHHHCDESVLTNHLIHVGFTSEGARRAAIVFKTNLDFASLGEKSPQLEMSAAFSEPNDEQPALQARETTAKASIGVSGNAGNGLPNSPTPLGLGQELPILVDGNRMARIPYPMSKKTFDRFLKMVELYRDILVCEESSDDSEYKELFS